MGRTIKSLGTSKLDQNFPTRVPQNSIEGAVKLFQIIKKNHTLYYMLHNLQKKYLFSFGTNIIFVMFKAFIFFRN